MQYHVIKKRMSPHVRAMLNSPEGSWDDHPQARAYADLNFLLGKDVEGLEVKALIALIHRAYGHKTSYEIELEAGDDGAEQIRENLEKIFVFENAPYPTELNQIACRHGGGSSLSVGDLVFVDAPKPMIFMCASVGYVQLRKSFVDAFKDIGPSIIVGEQCLNDTWAA
jgi:hypothetical protein